MNTKSELVTRDDLIGLTLAVLMFALQACMLMTMSTDRMAGIFGPAHGTIVAAEAARSANRIPA